MSEVHKRLQQLLLMLDDFNIAKLVDGKPGKWISIRKIDAPADEFFFRQQLENEIILELDRSTLEENEKLYELIKPKLVTEGIAFEAWSTQSKSYHVHTFFDRKLTDQERKAFIESIFTPEEIAGMDSNYWTKNARQLIAIEGAIHYKSGKPKILIETLGEGLNKFPDIKVPEEKKRNGSSEPKVKKTIGEILKDKNPSEQMKIGTVLDAALSRLLVLQEKYPDLKADRSFMNIQKNISYIERELAHERKVYNKRVSWYNVKLQEFPSNIIAKLFKFEEKPFFQFEQEE